MLVLEQVLKVFNNLEKTYLERSARSPSTKIEFLKSLINFSDKDGGIAGINYLRNSMAKEIDSYDSVMQDSYSDLFSKLSKLNDVLYTLDNTVDIPNLDEFFESILDIDFMNVDSKEMLLTREDIPFVSGEQLLNLGTLSEGVSFIENGVQILKLNPLDETITYIATQDTIVSLLTKLDKSELDYHRRVLTLLYYFLLKNEVNLPITIINQSKANRSTKGKSLLAKMKNETVLNLNNFTANTLTGNVINGDFSVTLGTIPINDVIYKVALL